MHGEVGDMKKEKRTLLVGVVMVVFVVMGSLAYWLIDGSLGRISAMIFVIFAMLCGIWLLADSIDRLNQDGGSLPPSTGGRGLWG